MKKLIAVLFLASIASRAAAEVRAGWYTPKEDKVYSRYIQHPYIEGLAGGSFLSDSVQSNVAYGVRAGTIWRKLDLSVGYLNNGGAEVKPAQDGLAPGQVDIKTLDAEMYFAYPMPYGLTVKAGGGLGYTWARDRAYPGSTFQTGGNNQITTSESINDGMSFIVGTSLERKLTEHLSLGLSLKYFLFSTTRDRTVVVQEDEGAEVYDSTSRVNLKALLLNFCFRVSF